MNHRLLYLDSSAIIKVIVPESGSEELLALLAQWPNRISSELARTEVLRALRRGEVTAAQFRRGQKILDRIGLVPIDSRIVNEAALLKPVALRTLDAIHLATAISIRGDLAGIVTYGTRLATAAAAAKLSVYAPGA